MYRFFFDDKYPQRTVPILSKQLKNISKFIIRSIQEFRAKYKESRTSVFALHVLKILLDPLQLTHILQNRILRQAHLPTTMVYWYKLCLPHRCYNRCHRRPDFHALSNLDSHHQPNQLPFRTTPDPRHHSRLDTETFSETSSVSKQHTRDLVEKTDI